MTNAKYPMINDKCSMINAKCPGFTLLELIIILFMMGLFITLVSQASSDKVNDKNYERTIQSMQEIKKAILGTHSERVRGDIRFAGYVEDMGDLPKLINGQPRGLWTRDIYNTPDNKEDDLPKRNVYFKIDETNGGKKKGGSWTKGIYLGWNGPYLKPPAGGILKDGWGNPFIFKRIGNNFIIGSLGADGKQGGTGYDRDIVFTIRENEWLAPVAGYISPYSVYHSREEIADVGLRDPNGFDLTVTAYIYYGPKSGDEPQKITCQVDQDGYFYFDKVPIGTERILAITQDNLGKPIPKITVEPGINWLGNMGSCP